VGYLSDTCYTEFGSILRREWTYQPVFAKGRRLFHSQLDLWFRTGDAPLGVTPYCHLEFSDDGGNVWRALPRRAMGEQGAYARIVRWSALGMARERVYRAHVSDAVPLHLVDTVLEVT
jgi:hypothetical protein